MNKLNLCLLVSMLSVLSACNNHQMSGKKTSLDHSINSSNSEASTEKVFTRDYLMRDLDNGLRVVIVPTEYPDIVSMQMPVQTGSRNEVEPGKSGFAHFFEHMMFRGTKNYTKDEYGEILKKMGADQNAYTTDDYTNYNVTFNKEDLETMLMLEADRFKNLQYTEAEFRTEALAVKGEYLKNSANPLSKIFETIRKQAFKDHTYRHTTMGFIEDIEDMPNQLEYSYEFFDRWYRPEKSALIIVGDVDKTSAFNLVEKYFADWQRGSYSVDIPQEGPAVGQFYEHIKWDSPTSPILTMAFRGTDADPNKKDKMALDMLGEIYFGTNSEAYQELVISKQLLDSLFYYSPDSKDPGLIYLAARLTDTSHYAEVHDSLIKTIVKARTQLPDQKQLDDLKSATRYEFANSLDNSEAIAEMLAEVVQYDRDPELVNRKFSTLQSITREDVKWAANHYLVDEGRIIVTLSEQEDVADFMTDYSLEKRVAQALQPVERSFQVVDLSSTSDIVDINFLFNTGAAYDPMGKKGLAQLTASMIAEGGSEITSYQEIQKAMYPMAAYFSAQVDKEMVSLAGRVHKDKLSIWMDLVLDSILQPGFREDDFNRLKTQQINAIQTDLKASNDEELGKEVLYEKIYAGHSYGSLNIGHVDDLASITLEDVKSFYQQQFVQANLTLGFTGGIDQEAQNKLINAVARRLPKGEKTADISANVAAPNGRHVTVVEKQTLPTAVSFGYPISVNRSHPDWVALWLVRSFLGEHRNSNSHLFQKIRSDRGMNYGDYAYIEYFPRGMFRTQPNPNLARSSQIFQVWLRPLRDNSDAHFATRLAVYEMDKLIQNGLTLEQFEGTRAFLMKYVGLLLKGQDRVLGYQLDSQYYNITNFADYVKGQLENLSLEQVNSVIKEHLQTENLEFVFITNDAQDMQQRLTEEKRSQMQYNSEKPADVLREDELIQDYPLNINKANVTLIPIEKVFK